MSKVIVAASTSLDGYIAGPDRGGFEHLFRWHHTGDIEIGTTNPKISFQLTEISAAYLRSQFELIGVILCGRGVFDLTGGWGGLHPMGVPVVVLTHQEPEGWAENENFHFATDGIESAVAMAKEIAGEKVVGVSAGVVGSQVLDAGLADEVWVDLVPVVLGDGVPFFSSLTTRPLVLDGPFANDQGVGVTHLKYRVAN